MVTPTRAVVFQQRLTYWKASRYRVIRKERHGVQLRGVAVHCRVDGRAAVVRAVYNSNAEPLQVLFESLFRPLPFLRTRLRLLRTVVLPERASVRRVPAATPDCTTHVVLRNSFACFGLHRV